jgi:hypothetical protein
MRKQTETKRAGILRLSLIPLPEMKFRLKITTGEDSKPDEKEETQNDSPTIDVNSVAKEFVNSVMINVSKQLTEKSPNTTAPIEESGLGQPSTDKTSAVETSEIALPGTTAEPIITADGDKPPEETKAEDNSTGVTNIGSDVASENSPKIEKTNPEEVDPYLEEQPDSTLTPVDPYGHDEEHIIQLSHENGQPDAYSFNDDGPIEESPVTPVEQPRGSIGLTASIHGDNDSPKEKHLEESRARTSSNNSTNEVAFESELRLPTQTYPQQASNPENKGVSAIITSDEEKQSLETSIPGVDKVPEGSNTVDDGDDNLSTEANISVYADDDDGDSLSQQTRSGESTGASTVVNENSSEPRETDQGNGNNSGQRELRPIPIEAVNYYEESMANDYTPPSSPRSSPPSSAQSTLSSASSVLPSSSLPTLRSDQSNNTVAEPVRSIGLRGTVYFYVNQDKPIPILMSGKINHTFELKYQEIPNDTDSPNQITHDITDALIVANVPVNGNAKPFNGNVTISRVIGNVSIGIGGNVYILPNIAHRTIQVSEITRITTPFNSTFRTGTTYKPFVQKYFEYSGKIYVNEWSSRIHWYTFYNPENYMVPRDPTQQDVKTGGFDIGNWALNKHKINMYIGRITLGNITIKPPPFSIDMQKTAVTGGTNTDKITQKKEKLKNKGLQRSTSLKSLGSPPFLGEAKKPASISHIDLTRVGDKKKPSTVKVKPDENPKHTEKDDEGLTIDHEKTPLLKNVDSDEKSIHTEKHPDDEGLFKMLKVLNDIGIPIDVNDVVQTKKIVDTFLKQIGPVIEQKLSTISPQKTADTELTELLTSEDVIKALEETANQNNIHLQPDTIKKLSQSEIPNSIAQIFKDQIQRIISDIPKPDTNAHQEIDFRIQCACDLITPKGDYHIHHTFCITRLSDNKYTISRVEHDTNQSLDKTYFGFDKVSLNIEGSIHFPQIQNGSKASFDAFDVDVSKPLRIEGIPFKPIKRTIEPKLVVNHIHIYKGDKPKTTGQNEDKPIIYVNITNAGYWFSLYKDNESSKSKDASVLCDHTYTSEITVDTKTNFTNLSLYVKPKEPEKKDSKKTKIKQGGHKTRRFRQ